MPRNAAIVFLLLICASLNACQDVERPQTAHPETVSQMPDNPVTSGQRSEELPVRSELLERSSWQDPFTDSFWQNDGWKFGPADMSAEASPARATLLRPWSRLMIEAQCDAVRPDDGLPDVKADLHLGFREADEAVQVRVGIWQDHVELQQLVDTEHWQTLKSARFDSEISGGRLRVNLTGNRILVAWNDRLVLNADRPSAIRRPVFVEIQSTGRPVEVSEMRLEGEYTSS